jgi:protein N-terminal methyltransferase
MSELTLAQVESALKKRIKKLKGSDTDGKDYTSIIPLWNYIFPTLSDEQVPKKARLASAAVNSADWYANANKYWENEANCPITDDGVLGGFGTLTELDTRDSNKFLDSLAEIDPQVRFDWAADCGAGIGRVTKNFLLPRYGHVDLVEQSPRLLNSAPAYIGVGADSERIRLIEIGLQDFVPEEGKYDMIWIQWVIGHLHDLHFVEFFQRCARGLNEHGFIVLKDNCIMKKSHAFSLDLNDNSVCRNITYFDVLFKLAGMEIVSMQLQTDFPEELYPVMMFALRKKSS